MAVSRTPGPLLASSEGRQSHGLTLGTCYAIPGPLGLADGEGSASEPQVGGALDLENALASPEGVSFKLGAATYRVRLASRGARPGEEPVARQRALSILEEGTFDPGQADNVVGLLRSIVLQMGDSPGPSSPLLFREQSSTPGLRSPTPPAPPPSKPSPPPKPKAKPAPPPAKPPPTYTFVWDDPFSQRQWVNLPNAWGVVAFGKEAKLTGHVEPRAGGQAVTFALLPDAANPSEATGAALGATSATSDGDGKVQVKLTFPVYPGAKFKVSGKTATMGSPVTSDPMTVWRRVYYQVTEMAAATDGTNFRAPSDLIPALRGAFDPVWVELAEGTKKSDTTPYRAHLTAAERSSVESSLRASAVDNRSPFKMNIVLIDSADIVAEQEWTSQTVGPNVETLPFTKWVHEPTIIRAEYEQAPASWAPLNRPTVVDLSGGRAKVTATIPGAPSAAVRVRIKYRYQRGFAGGWGGTAGTIFMCIGRERRANASSPTGAQLQQALTHEIGHALGLVSPSASWHDPDPRDAGYSLRHCGYKTSANDPRCVMWFMLGGSGDRLRFCKSNAPNDCTHFLLRADLSTIHWI